jgi:GAF domain-containing protein
VAGVEDELEREGAEVLRRVAAALAGIGGGDVSAMLRAVVEAAVEAVGATYGAMGVLDPTRTRLEDFITVGLDEAVGHAIGALPQGHGILGLLIVRPEPIRVADIATHPERYGFPPGHPAMGSFLGVPVVVRGEVFGNLYLTDKRGADGFSELDQHVAEALAAATACLIDNARLHDRLATLDDALGRERAARELHDLVAQRIAAAGFSLRETLDELHDPAARERLERVLEDLDATARTQRTAMFAWQIEHPLGRSARAEVLGVVDERIASGGPAPSCAFVGAIDTIDDHLAGDLVEAAADALAVAAQRAPAGPLELTVALASGWLVLSVEGPAAIVDPDAPPSAELDRLRALAATSAGEVTQEALGHGRARLSWRVPADR